MAVVARLPLIWLNVALVLVVLATWVVKGAADPVSMFMAASSAALLGFRVGVWLARRS